MSKVFFSMHKTMTEKGKALELLVTGPHGKISDELEALGYELKVDFADTHSIKCHSAEEVEAARAPIMKYMTGETEGHKAVMAI
jgi:hypothetical protein